MRFSSLAATAQSSPPGRPFQLGLPVLVVPCGSGNDFARALGLRKVSDALEAWQGFCSSGHNLKTIDLGVIAPLDSSGSPKPENRRYFCCVGGVGLDSDVARLANRLPRWVRGHGGYALSLLPAVFRFTPVTAKITLAGREQAVGITAEANRLVLAAFANAPTYGGGLRIAPQAQLDDGKLTSAWWATSIDSDCCACFLPSISDGT